jgi:hypothetical protein
VAPKVRDFARLRRLIDRFTDDGVLETLLGAGDRHSGGHADTRFGLWHIFADPAGVVSGVERGSKQVVDYSCRQPGSRPP